MSKYTRLLAALDDAYEEGRQRARRGHSRISFYCMCEHGRWLDAACLAGYDAALNEIRQQRDLLDHFAPRTPLPPPPPRCTSRAPRVQPDGSLHLPLDPRCVLPQDHDEWHSDGNHPTPMRWT